MFKSLYFKIVLILLIFIFAVMSSVGAILMNGVTSFYADDFARQMNECFDADGILMSELKSAAVSEGYPTAMKTILGNYGSMLGIDSYRNYYILNTDGDMLAGSDTALGAALTVTPNLLAAMSSESGNISSGGLDYSDWAIRLSAYDGECIVYIKDSLEEMTRLNAELVTIVIEALAVGIIIAIILSFFLAKSISSPLQKLTKGTQRVAEGRFTNDDDIELKSSDEIGVLAENFNYMKKTLKNTLEDVEGEREKLDTMLSCMKDAVLAFTADGSVLHSNNSAKELFGDGVRRMTAERCFEFLDLPLTMNGGAASLTSESTSVEETKDGYIFRDRIAEGKVYDVTFAAIHYNQLGFSDDDTDGEGTRQSTGCVVVVHDVTGRYELDESRREFVANVSHELRTPLTSIKGAAETVRMDEDMDAATRAYFLDMVLSETDRMTRIVSDLLVLSRLDNNRTKWSIETFDLKASVRHLCEVMRGDFEAHGHTVSFGTDRNLPEITADRQRIEQVIINVISNAIKYTPQGGRIDIRITGSRTDGGKFAVIRVADNGIGIPKADIPHLFERFYRVEKSRTQDAGGTGLGLAIAREITEAHGGSITVESEVDRGTTVVVRLPFECAINTSEQ